MDGERMGWQSMETTNKCNILMSSNEKNRTKIGFEEIPPFSIINASSSKWKKKRTAWLNMGIDDGAGRNLINSSEDGDYRYEYVSHFDPALAELMYQWFCPEGGIVLDPFAGGPVRGIVAAKLGIRYTGIDIRPEQIKADREQANAILVDSDKPLWICDDSYRALDELWGRQYDMIFTCPPYGNLEVYSRLDGDLSNMDYGRFLKAYREIIRKCCSLVKRDGFIVFVVGEFRDKRGNYVGFVPETVKAFTDCGIGFYNEIIFSTPVYNSWMRWKNNMKTKKVVKVHQNILVFRNNIPMRSMYVLRQKEMEKCDEQYLKK